MIEDRSIVFIGATTKNPSFEVKNALVSRCRLLTLNKLRPKHKRKLLEWAMSDSEKGLMASLRGVPGVTGVKVEEEATELLACASDGDARVALNALEIAAFAAASQEKDQTISMGRPIRMDFEAGSKNFSEKEDYCKGDHITPFKKFQGSREAIAYTPYKTRELKKMDPSYSQSMVVSDVGASGFPDPHKTSKESAWVTGGPVTDGIIAYILVDDVKKAVQCKHLIYDRAGEEHYNIISAVYKSMRGSDFDAALYWLARMLEGGENPLYIARGLISFASEDVGLADPLALTQAVAYYQACHFLGMPERNVHLAQCVAYLSLALKSVVVYQGIKAAQRLVREKGQNDPVPLHLRNAPTKLMKELGYGKGYKTFKFQEEEDVNLDDVDAVFDDLEEHLVTEKKEIQPVIMNAFELILAICLRSDSAWLKEKQDLHLNT